MVKKNKTAITNYNEKYMSMLREIILSKIDTEKVMVFVFGSRVFDRHPSRADVDIGLLTDDKLPIHLFHKIQNAVDDSIIPLEIDLVDFTRANTSFKETALKDIVIWNKPKAMKKNLIH
ncbi:MAG: nucleotidyltransferase domain-containing protein [Desulfobacteraceae bacterium]|nr:nucleotidyltransferase domain-containing protein [Desulfobacteraceae bacterium]